jgi:hypothetical protein
LRKDRARVPRTSQPRPVPPTGCGNTRVGANLAGRSARQPALAAPRAQPGAEPASLALEPRQRAWGARAASCSRRTAPNRPCRTAFSAAIFHERNPKLTEPPIPPQCINRQAQAAGGYILGYRHGNRLRNPTRLLGTIRHRLRTLHRRTHRCAPGVNWRWSHYGTVMGWSDRRAASSRAHERHKVQRRQWTTGCP